MGKKNFFKVYVYKVRQIGALKPSYIFLIKILLLKNIILKILSYIQAYQINFLEAQHLLAILN